jgi:hypothetical protein
MLASLTPCLRQIGDRNVGLMLVQNSDDLLFGKAATLRGLILVRRVITAIRVVASHHPEHSCQTPAQVFDFSQ